MGNPGAATRIERSQGRFILSSLSECCWMGADKSVRGPLHPHYRRDSGGPCHQQTLGSSRPRENERRLRQVSADGRAIVEVSRRQPTRVSSLLTKGQGVHGQWVGPKRATLIQLGEILFAFCVLASGPLYFSPEWKITRKTSFPSLFYKDNRGGIGAYASRQPPGGSVFNHAYIFIIN